MYVLVPQTRKCKGPSFAWIGKMVHWKRAEGDNTIQNACFLLQGLRVRLSVS